MKSKIAHNIKHRLYANDEFPTPPELCKELISKLSIESCSVVLEPAVGCGNFYNAFLDIWNKRKTNDFNSWDKKVDWIVSNPPYSQIDCFLDKSCDIARVGFAYLLTLHNLTPKRIEMCEQKGFGITSIFLCKVFHWFGISAFIIWEKDKKSIITYDRIVWR